MCALVYLWATVALPLLGCATADVRREAPPFRDEQHDTFVESVDAERLLEAERPLAQWYGKREPATLQGFELGIARNIREVVRQERPGTVLEPDEAACQTARDICRGLPTRGTPPTRLIDFAQRAHGLIEPPPHLIVAEIPTGSEDTFGQDLEARLKPVMARTTYRRLGVGLCSSTQSGDGGRRVVIALLESPARIEPLRRQLAVGEVARLAARVVAGYRQVRLVVASPGRRVDTVDLDQRKGAYTTTVACEREGAYRFEITAQGRHGDEVLANFPVYCGVEPPEGITFGPVAEQSGNVGAIEAEVMQLTNAYRRDNALPLLMADSELAEVARRHSRDMLDAGFVGHVSARSGTPADRVKGANIDYLVLRENVARGYAAAEIVHELINSPAHRANLLGDDVTGLGVGAAVDHRGPNPALLVTQLFIRRPGEVLRAP